MDMKEIGATIRAARKKMGISQSDLAKPLKMSRATISGLENGNVHEIGLRKTMAICAALGLEILAMPKRRYPTLQELQKELHEKKIR